VTFGDFGVKSEKKLQKENENEGVPIVVGGWLATPGGCEINCVNGHRYVNLIFERNLLWLTGHGSS